jgi:hypothetical protein
VRFNYGVRVEGQSCGLPPIRASRKLKMIPRSTAFHVESPEATVAV